MNRIVTAAALACAMGIGQGAQAADPVADIEGTKPRVERAFSYILGIQTGNNLRKQLPAALGDLDLEAMMQGIRESIEGADPRMDVADMTFWSGKFLKMLDDRRKASGGANLAAGKRFREEYQSAMEDVKSTSSGILYRETAVGSGRQPGIGQSVTVHYEGRLIDGTVFDSSRERGEPASLRVRDVIPGWQEVLTLMSPGSRWEVVIPPEMAYGKAGAGTIGPSSTLVFDIELISIE